MCHTQLTLEPRELELYLDLYHTQLTLEPRELELYLDLYHTQLTLELHELELYLDWCHSLLMIYSYEKKKGYFPFYPHSLDNQYIQSHQYAKVLAEILQHLNLYFDYKQQAQCW